MDSKQIFIGNIKKCTKYDISTTFSSETYIGEQCISCDSFGYIQEESEIAKENAVLIRVAKSRYVDIDSYRSAVDYFKVRQSLTGTRMNMDGIVMSTSPYHVGCLFVDEDSLQPYYTEEQDPKNISVRKLKKELRQKNNS